MFPSEGDLVEVDLQKLLRWRESPERGLLAVTRTTLSDLAPGRSPVFKSGSFPEA